ncbi:MAG: hypothetical protein K2X32_12585 [Phycisphaerales bacterium]|nr:hypothetical protein [Phycisphaerales bacterium]
MWSFIRKLFGGGESPAKHDAALNAPSSPDRGSLVRPSSVAATAGVAASSTGNAEVPAPISAHVQSGGAGDSDDRFVPDEKATRFEELPGWAAPLENVEQLNDFVALVYRYFSLRKVPSKLEDGRVVAADPAFASDDATDESDGGSGGGVGAGAGVRRSKADGAGAGMWRGSGKLHRFGLWNLMQVCAGTPREEWAGMVAAHFDSVRRAPETEQRYSERLASLASAREHLVLRVFDQSHLPEDVQRESVARREVPGLVTIVVVDFPETCRSLQRKEAAAWGASDDEVWAAAMENTPRMARADSRLMGDRSSPIRLLSGSSIYVASLIHAMESVPEATGVYGGFVSVPTRSVLMALPFDGAEAMQSLALFIGMTNQLEAMGPGSVSRRVWWADREGMSEISYRLRDRQVEIDGMPESLQQLLISLGNGPEDDDQFRA